MCRGRRQRIILLFSDWMCHVSGMQLEINQPKLSPIPFHCCCCCCCLYDERELPTYNILRYYAISAAHIYHHHRCRLRRHHCDRKSMTMKKAFFLFSRTKTRGFFTAELSSFTDFFLIFCPSFVFSQHSINLRERNRASFNFECTLLSLIKHPCSFAKLFDLFV